MNNLVLQVQPGTLPSGTCVPGDSLQALLNVISENQTVTFPASFSGVYTGGTPPSDTTQTWVQTDSQGRPVRTYIFSQGAWLSLHPIPPGMIMIWPFATPDFTTFDGGDANPLSQLSGPMWQTPQDNSGNPILTAQVPLGFGTLPSGTVIGGGSNGGEETHILSVPEMAPHTHEVENVVAQNPGNFAGGGYQGSVITNINTDRTGGNPQAVPPYSAAAGHNTLPPYYGVLFIQRSARLFYAAS